MGRLGRGQRGRWRPGCCLLAQGRVLGAVSPEKPKVEGGGQGPYRRRPGVSGCGGVGVGGEEAETAGDGGGWVSGQDGQNRVTASLWVGQVRGRRTGPALSPSACRSLEVVRTEQTRGPGLPGFFGPEGESLKTFGATCSCSVTLKSSSRFKCGRRGRSWREGLSHGSAESLEHSGLGGAVLASLPLSSPAL